MIIIPFPVLLIPREERELLIQKLSEIDPRYARGELEEEWIDAYGIRSNKPLPN